MPMPTYPSIRLAFPDYLAVLRVVRQFKPDIIHCATEFTIGRLGQMAARATQTPLVTSYHTDFGKYVHAYGFPLVGSQVTSYITRFHKRAQRTYTPSRPAQGDLYNMGIKHAEVWGCGVDTDVFHPGRKTAELRAKLALSPDTFLFVHVGRLAREKSVHVMLDAYRTVRERLPGRRLHFVIAGTGPCEADLRRQAPEGVTFIGHLDRQTALPALYASSDAFLFSSLTETLGLVVLEAMSSGLPVIAAPAGGVADHLHDEINGLAYPALDAGKMAAQMVRLVTEGSLRYRLSIGARKTVEPLSWRYELDRLDASYRAVVLASGVPVSERVLCTQ
jgi:glycosyltransferase involved in cell wall biosynthesis